jgi:hypothetical protein
MTIGSLVKPVQNGGDKQTPSVVRNRTQRTLQQMWQRKEM